MRKLFGSILLLLLLSPGLSKFAGYEDTLDEVVQTYKALIEEVDKSFMRVTYYFDNLENYETDQELMTPVFADNLSFTVHTLLEFKLTVYANLRKLATMSNEISKKQSSFDLHLSLRHRNLLLFVTSLPEDAVPAVLHGLFGELKNQRSLLGVSCRDLKDAVQSNLVNTVNLYDLLEEFVHDLPGSGANGSFGGVTVRDIQGYRYIMGFLNELRKLYHQHNTLLEKINQALLGIDQYLQGFDEALDGMDFYYQKRYVEGVSEDALFDPEAPHSLNRDAKKTKKDSTQDAKPICDKLLLNNFGNDGGQGFGFEVSPYERLPFCPSIEWSCCSASVIEEALDHYADSSFSNLQDIYERTERLFRDILNSYSDYNRIAYELLSSPRLKPVCEDKLRRLVFFPLNRQFFSNFLKDLKRSLHFSLKAKADVFCMVCDQSFHRGTMEGGRIRMERQFCVDHSQSSLPFYRTYASVLYEYINAIIEALQCDRASGQYHEEFSRRLSVHPRLQNILDGCQETDDFCEPLCQQFSFTSVKTPLDMDLALLEKVHQFIQYKMELFGVTAGAGYDRTPSHLGVPEYRVQKESTLGFRSLDNLSLIFENGDDTLANPAAQGEAIVAVLSNESLFV